MFKCSNALIYNYSIDLYASDKRLPTEPVFPGITFVNVEKLTQ